MVKKRNTDGARAAELQKAGIVSLCISGLLTAAKLVVGFISGSTAVISDGAHSLSDAFTTVMVIVGIKISGGAADKEHQYGHHRVESLVSLAMAFILGTLAFFLGREGVLRLFGETAAEPSFTALCVTLLSIASQEFMFQYAIRKARKYNSSSMMSDAWHHRSDAISSVAVLIGVLGTFLGVPVLDPAATLAVCAILFKVSFDIGKNAVNQLIDRAADKETAEIIRSAALSVNGVNGIDLLNTRVSNNVIFVDIEITVEPSLSVEEGHLIAENVHDSVETAVAAVEHCMVHVNPKTL